MKFNKLFIPLLVALSSLPLNACGKRVIEENDPVTPYDMMYFFPFDKYQEVPKPNYFKKSSYNRVKLAGHELTSFDENEDVARFVHDADRFYNYEEITSKEFKKTDYYFQIYCSEYNPLKDKGVLTYYDNGCVSCKITSSYSKNREYFFKLDEENTKAIFDIVEKDIAEVESGKRHYYEDVKSYCSLEALSALAEKDFADERIISSFDVNVQKAKEIYPESRFSGISDSNKTRCKEFHDMIQATNHTFKGYKSVDYNAIRESIVYFDYQDDYAWYAYVLEDECDYTKADIAMLYGDYNDGKYHFLLAQYEISHEEGQALVDYAIAPLRVIS